MKPYNFVLLRKDLIKCLTVTNILDGRNLGLLLKYIKIKNNYCNCKNNYSNGYNFSSSNSYNFMNGNQDRVRYFF